MTYQQQLKPWVVNRLSANGVGEVSRFRRRGEAEAFMRAMEMRHPQAQFVIVFDGAKTAEEKLAQPV
jgi:hypothetical protein